MKTRFVEQLADSPKRVRIMFRVAVVILLAVGCCNWMVQPQACYLSAAQQRSRLAAMGSDQQKQMLSSIELLKKKLNEMESQSEQINKVLFGPDAVRQFFCGLETQAAQTGCRIESLTFSDTGDQSSQKPSQALIVQAVEASVIVVGNYNALTRFFDLVGQCPQKISINELRLEPQIPGKPTLRCTMTMAAYMSNKTVAGNHKTNPETVQ